jgi:Ala-tRNA(Pro) deacylase
MTCKERLQASLDGEHVPYELQQHSVAYTAQQIAASEHISGRLVAKVVIVLANGGPVVLTLPASNRVDFERVKEILHARDVRLADETEVAPLFPDCEVGAMPPFGNLYELPVVVDQQLAEDEYIVFPVGTHTETMRLRYDDFARVVRPVVADVARHP